MPLSLIVGNKDVSNLVFMASTNYLNKIDEAIRRRLSVQYQVGRPNP
jgi:SpoVK/Ycf46/Vps4 family AAA+-type ATPase